MKVFIIKGPLVKERFVPHGVWDTHGDTHGDIQVAVTHGSKIMEFVNGMKFVCKNLTYQHWNRGHRNGHTDIRNEMILDNWIMKKVQDVYVIGNVIYYHCNMVLIFAEYVVINFKWPDVHFIYI